MIDMHEVGAHPAQRADGLWQVRFGIYLPGITFPKGYRVKVRVIHERDQFVHGIEPVDVDLWWWEGTPLDLWNFTVDFAPGVGHFGQEGTYLYRYQLLRGDRILTTWFADPFGRANGFGGVSAFTIDANAQPFPWADDGFSVPEVDDLVVYELHVAEFNRNFDGVTAQLDYLAGLGVNTLELMPVTDVKEEVEWGYTPLGYFAPDERFGGVHAFKRLVDAAHARGIAVIVDAVYAHAHPEFAYNIVYARSGEDNPMMGRFAEEFFSWAGTDYRKAFTRDYFLAVNRHWLTELHVDGFRYDYVPGIYDGPVGVGYADLVFETHRLSQDPALRRFAGPDGRSNIIQCAEHLPGPQEILSKTYSNTCWQNRLLDLSIDMARRRYVSDALGHQLDPEFNGYPSEFFNPATGERQPVAPFQYLETHDHGRFLARLAPGSETDLIGQPYGERRLFYRIQPYVIALYTGKGVPMLWQGQEFGENWNVPGGGIGRNLFERPLHWEYFYDPYGKALVRLHRIMGGLRRRLRPLKSRGWFFYFDDSAHRQQGVVAFLRQAGGAAEYALVLLNFSDADAQVSVQFPAPGRWVEQIDAGEANARPDIDVSEAGRSLVVRVPSNYGGVYIA